MIILVFPSSPMETRDKISKSYLLNCPLVWLLLGNLSLGTSTWRHEGTDEVRIWE